jgi:type I restriction enzyme R subunit
MFAKPKGIPVGGVISLGDRRILRPMPTPEDQASEHIDQALEQAGWRVQDYKSANLGVGRGVVLRNFPLQSEHKFADYLLYLDGKAAGVVEAKKEGFPLIGVEIQSTKYSEGLSPQLPAHVRPLPFLYQSTVVETRFTNGLDPEPRSRQTFAFHKPDTLAEWMTQSGVQTEAPIRDDVAALKREPYRTYSTLKKRLQQLPVLKTEGLWPAQVTAINNLEKSLAQDRARAAGTRIQDTT